MSAGSLVSFTEMGDMASSGTLEATSPVPISDETVARDEYAGLIKHTGVEWSGLLPTECMSDSEMVEWADITVPPPPPPSAATETVDIDQPLFTGGPLIVSASAAHPDYPANFMRVWEVRRWGAAWYSASTIGQSSIEVPGDGLSNGDRLDARVRYVSGGVDGTPSSWSYTIVYRA